MVAVDCSGEALALARANQDAGRDRRASLVACRADLCAALRPGFLDALVSNPPYLSVSEYAGLDPSVRDWEPALAL